MSDAEKSKLKPLVIYYAVIFSLYAFTRLLFISSYLYTQDCAAFALGILNWDVLSFRPHPPGYPFFIFAGKIINAFTDNPHTSLRIFNFITGFLTICLLEKWGRDLYRSKSIAIELSLLLLFAPTFWFQNEIITTYTSGMFFSSLTAYLGYLTLYKNKQYLVWFSILTGITGGIRPSLLIFLSPLWCWVFFKTKSTSMKKRIYSIISLIVVTLLWVKPLMWNTGGIKNFITFSRSYAENFSLNYQHSLIKGFTDYIARTGWTLGGGSIFLLLIPLCFMKKRNNINPVWSYLSIWFLPSSLFFISVHMGQSGYELAYLFPLLLIAGYVLGLIKPFPRRILLAIIILVNISASLSPPGNAVEKFFQSFFVQHNYLTLPSIRNRNHEIEEKLIWLKKHADPDRSYLFTEYKNPYITSRHFSYYQKEWEGRTTEFGPVSVKRYAKEGYIDLTGIDKIYFIGEELGGYIEENSGTSKIDFRYGSPIFVMDTTGPSKLYYNYHKIVLR